MPLTMSGSPNPLSMSTPEKAAKQLWWKEASGFEPNCDAEGMECVTAGDLENEGAFNAMRDARLEKMYHALGGDTPAAAATAAGN